LDLFLFQIDFQAPYWGSPIYDLLYLLVSSANTEVLIARFDELIAFYHEHLEKNLQILAYGRPILTLKQLHSDILERGQFGLVCMANILAIVCIDAKENASLDKFMSPDPEARAFVKRVYANPVYLRKVELLLPFFEQRGFLE
jgi:Ecdysteroid kinase-like family